VAAPFLSETRSNSRPSPYIHHKCAIHRPVGRVVYRLSEYCFLTQVLLFRSPSLGCRSRLSSCVIGTSEPAVSGLTITRRNHATAARDACDRERGGKPRMVQCSNYIVRRLEDRLVARLVVPSSSQIASEMWFDGAHIPPSPIQHPKLDPTL